MNVCRIFLSHTSKKYRRGTFLCFRNFLVSKYCLDERVGSGGGGGEFHNFPSKSLPLTVPKNFGGKSLSVSSISGIEILYENDGYVMNFCGRLFVSQCRKTSQGNPSEFQKYSGAKKVMDKKVGVRGLSRITLRNVFSHSAEENRTGILQCFI